jgi:anti-anti-sigma regulatory factor
MTHHLASPPYFIWKHPKVFVLSFGTTPDLASELLIKCRAEVTSHSQNTWVFNCQGIRLVGTPALKPFIQLQEAIRTRPGRLRLCYLNPEVKEFLIEKKALRPEELASSVEDALRRLSFENVSKRKF